MSAAQRERSGIFLRPTAFLAACVASPPASQAGTDYHPLSSLAPSAVCPRPFSMRDIPKALPGWLLVSLLDTGQLKLGANCSLCWTLGATAGTVEADL